MDMLPQSKVDRIQKWHREGLALSKVEIQRRLKARECLPKSEQGSIEALIEDVFNAHTAVTGRSVDTAYRAGLDIATPVRRPLIDRPDAYGNPRGPRCGEHVYDVPVRNTLEALVAGNPSLLAEFRSAAHQWSQCGAASGAAATVVYSDITDGSMVRDHPELGVNADTSDGSTRIGLILYYDDVEVVNAIGSFAGVHKLGLFYWAFVNHDASKRMALHNIHLATVALESDISYYGIEQIVSGPPGEPSTGSSIGASLRELDTGVHIKIDGKENTLPATYVRGWLILVAADYPAAALMTGSMKGATAIRFCRECEIDRHTDDIHTPNSFVDPAQPSAYPLRTPASYSAAKASCGCNKAKMSAAGWSSWEHAFTRIPKFNMLRGVPPDLMHIECEGTLKGEAAALIFYCVRIAKYFDLDDLNAALDMHPFPQGSQPPYFTENVLAGRDAKKTKRKPKPKPIASPIQKKRSKAVAKKPLPKMGCHVHMTSGQMLTFTIHSPALFRTLGVPDNDEVLRCWLTHVQYFTILLQHSISRADVTELDRLIRLHHSQLAEIECYDGLWKPKHHFATHFPLAILLYGPLRHYWCMRFEAKNQGFKKIAVGGSYRDTTKRCADFDSVQAARNRQSGRASSWGEDTTQIQSTLTYQRTSTEPVPEPVAWFFQNMFPSAPALTIEWLASATVEGIPIRPGLTWVQYSLAVGGSDGQLFLGYVTPDRSLLSLNGQVYLFVDLYPALAGTAGVDMHSTWTEDYDPPQMMLSLVELQTLVCLRPVSETVDEDAGTVTRHFVLDQ